MSIEVFRFVTIRPPQQAIDSQSAQSTVPLGNQKSPLADSLRQMRSSNSQDKMVGRVKQFIASTDFIDSARQFDKAYLSRSPKVFSQTAQPKVVR